MDLQSIFYVFAIMAMIMLIVFLAVGIYVFLFIRTFILRTEMKVMSRIIEFTKPLDIAKELASSVLGNFLFRWRPGNHRIRS